ncbi:MAG: FtsX-like permease family protein [Solirubrobacteraceae bacterium]
MRPSALLYMYARRLRAHGPQECFAGIGIAIAVALVFAATLAEGSISSSAGAAVRVVVGPASLQLRARSDDGFSEAPLARVRRLPGVEQAAPLLEQTASIVGANGSSTTVDLAGVDLRLAVLDGLAEKLPVGALKGGGISLSSASAHALGISGKRGEVTLQARGRSERLGVSTVFGAETAGALAHTLVAVMPLRDMQRFAGLRDRVTRILVQTQPGAEATVRAELERLAGGRIEVAPADEDIAALRQALGPSGLASGLFAAIGALLGFLIAFNAMLLTVSDRRRTISDLRVAGAKRTTIVEMVFFQALCLGIAASLIGLLAGYGLSVGVLHQSTRYLAGAFTLSSATVVQTRALLASFLGGVLATCLASGVVLLDLRRSHARDAIYEEGGIPGNALNGAAQRSLFAAALCLLAGASALLLLAPAAAIAATALLALATVCAVPLAFTGVLHLAQGVAERWQRISILPIALASLRASTMRSLALAATGAVALFGSVALGGSRANLLDGIGTFAHSYVADADLWVANPGDNQAVATFAAGDYAQRISRLPAVASVQSFQGGFLQLAQRRVWIIARPPGGDREVLRSQVTGGDWADAVKRLGEGGWIAVSKQIAAEHHTGVGGSLILPTPTGNVRFRVAATTTNLAWPPGVIFIGAADYSHDWSPTHATDPTALGVRLRPGANAVAAQSAIERALGGGPGSGDGLEVSLARARARRIEALASEGLAQLQEISTLLLIAAICAMFAALASSVYQRRAALAALRLSGATRNSVRAVLALEALLMLGTGCLVGAVAGVYGQVVVDAFLRHVTGFPLASPTGSARPLEVFALVLAFALALGAIPGWLASRVAPVLALENE